MVTKEMWKDRFADNEFTTKYFELCSEPFDGKGEKHHILPRSMWPEYASCSWNLVNLSYQDHYQAHEMLSKICLCEIDRGKMVKSLWIITNRYSGDIISPEDYEKLKIAARESISNYMIGNSNSLGTKYSEEVRNKFSLAKLGEKNPMYRISPEDHPMYGKTHTDEAKLKISQSSKGNTHRRGKKFSQESVLRLSKAASKFVYIKLDGDNHIEYTTDELRLAGYNVRFLRQSIRANTRYLGYYWSRRPK